MSALETIKSLMPPPAEPSSLLGDWSIIESSLGFSLPSDYKAFIDTYGSGLIGKSLHVNNPFDFRGDARKYWTNWASMYHDFAEYGGAVIPYPVFPVAQGLIPFGSLADVHFLNWLAIGEADHWPFVYYHRDRGFTEIKGLTAVEFILEAITKRSPLLAMCGSENLFDSPCTFKPFSKEK